jgi:UDP-N-acetylmuramate dehydrogenase
MNIFSGLEEIVKTDCSLREYTWYGMGGKADYLVVPQDVEQLKTVVTRCNENNLPFYVLGFGSNLLIKDKGVKGAVIKLGGVEFAETRFEDEWVTAGAGASLSNLVLDCVRKGLSGLEPMTGIPGSIGGAVKINSGGSFGDIGAAVQSVMLMDKDVNIFEKTKPELIFDYRHSNISASFILGAKMKLATGEPEQIMRTTKEIWIRKKNSQPLSSRNSGCIFRNPPGMSAGALIDRAGLKGLAVGGAMVSEKHANFIIANDGCSSNDVIRLIEIARQRVKENFDVDLELEIEIW